MRDVHLREVNLNLPTLSEERHVIRAAKRRLTDVHALSSMIASLRAALDDVYAVPLHGFMCFERRAEARRTALGRHYEPRISPKGP